MKQISDEDFEFLQSLKMIEHREKIKLSLESITRLVDDIDYPIMRSVAMIALLGCSPQWSCCGFNYWGQPYHKCHSAVPYVMMDDNSSTRSLVARMISSDMPYIREWKVGSSIHDGKSTFDIQADIRRHGTTWNSQRSVHYYELGSTYIKYLEDFLLSLKDGFMDEVTLIDSNEIYAKRFDSWQYPHRELWVIRKADIL